MTVNCSILYGTGSFEDLVGIRGELIVGKHIFVWVIVVAVATGIHDDVQILGTAADTTCHLDDVAHVVTLHEHVVDVLTLNVDPLFVSGGGEQELVLRWNQTAGRETVFNLNHILVDPGELLLVLGPFVLRDFGIILKGLSALLVGEGHDNGLRRDGGALAERLRKHNVVHEIDAASSTGNFLLK